MKGEEREGEERKEGRQMEGTGKARLCSCKNSFKYALSCTEP